MIGILVRVGDAVRVERLGHRADQLAVAELQDVADAGDRARDPRRAGRPSPTARPARRGRRRRAARCSATSSSRARPSARAPTPRFSVEPDHGGARRLELVERPPGLLVGRLSSTTHDVDRLRLLDRGDGLGDQPPLAVARDDHGDPRRVCGRCSSRRMMPGARPTVEFRGSCAPCPPHRPPPRRWRARSCSRPRRRAAVDWSAARIWRVIVTVRGPAVRGVLGAEPGPAARPRPLHPRAARAGARRSPPTSASTSASAAGWGWRRAPRSGARPARSSSAPTAARRTCPGCWRRSRGSTRRPTSSSSSTTTPAREDSRAVIEAAGATYVREDRRGLDHARTAGLRAAGGELVAFTDDDCVPAVRWLADLGELFAAAVRRRRHGPGVRVGARVARPSCASSSRVGSAAACAAATSTGRCSRRSTPARSAPAPT